MYIHNIQSPKITAHQKKEKGEEKQLQVRNKIKAPSFSLQSGPTCKIKHNPHSIAIPKRDREQPNPRFRINT